jgi:hypothetical protein
MIENQRHCLNRPLSKFDKLQLVIDYSVAISITLIINILFILGEIPTWIYTTFILGFFMGASFEYIQPRLGWVCYYKCITYKLAPMRSMWIIHSVWDSLIFHIILYLSYLIWGQRLYHKFIPGASLFMGFLGMAQEIFVECYQTLWYYRSTKFNPTWAIIRGRNMTLQQWHWSILPPLYYIIVINYLYP